jgi:hypothetical protein
MKQKGRNVPPATVDHAAALRERLGKAAHDAAAGSPSDEWEALTDQGRAYWRNVGQAVMRELVKRDPRTGEISTEGIVSAQTGKPFVQFACDISPTQLTPGKAREVALMLLEAADAAESDAVLMAFARESIGLDDVRAAQLLDQFRKSREKARGTEVESA